MTDVLTIPEVCARLGCKRRRVFELLADGTLERAPRYGRELRIYAASVDRALAPTPATKRAARRVTRYSIPKAPAELLA